MFMTPPKTIYRQQQPTRLGPLFQTPSVNGLGHSASSTLALVTTHHNFLSYAHCFNWPVLLLTPLSPMWFWASESVPPVKLTDIHFRYALISVPVFAMGWAGPWAMGRAGPWAGLGLKFWDFNGLRAGLGWKLKSIYHFFSHNLINHPCQIVIHHPWIAFQCHTSCISAKNKS